MLLQIDATQLPWRRGSPFAGARVHCLDGLAGNKASAAMATPTQVHSDSHEALYVGKTGAQVLGSQTVYLGNLDNHSVLDPLFFNRHEARHLLTTGILVELSSLPLEIQIWLAMAYDANRRHKDCIALYKQLEKTHPMISIRRQAADFRYIAEAPKLKISNDEVVTIPQIGTSWDWYARTWSDKIEEQEERNRKIVAASSQPESSANVFSNLFLLRPPSEWKKSAWAIVTLWIVLIGTAFYLQR